VTIHLCGPPEDTEPGLRGGPPVSSFGLAPSGVYLAIQIAPNAGALLPHRFTITCDRLPGPSAVYSLWHFPAGYPDWPLASTLTFGAPTFLDPVSNPTRPRSLDQLSQTDTTLQDADVPGRLDILSDKPPVQLPGA